MADGFFTTVLPGSHHTTLLDYGFGWNMCLALPNIMGSSSTVTLWWYHRVTGFPARCWLLTLQLCSFCKGSPLPRPTHTPGLTIITFPCSFFTLPSTLGQPCQSELSPPVCPCNWRKTHTAPNSHPLLSPHPTLPLLRPLLYTQSWNSRRNQKRAPTAAPPQLALLAGSVVPPRAQGGPSALPSTAIFAQGHLHPSALFPVFPPPLDRYTSPYICCY